MFCFVAVPEAEFQERDGVKNIFWLFFEIGAIAKPSSFHVISKSLWLYHADGGGQHLNNQVSIFLISFVYAVRKFTSNVI